MPLGVQKSASRAYNFINQSSELEYIDKAFAIIEEGLLESQYYSLGVANWLNVNNRTPKVRFISWERGYWGSVQPGTFMAPYKHPDQAILNTVFDNNVIFVILDAPGVLPVTPVTPTGTGALGIYNVNGERAFGGGAGKNPAFNNINAQGYSVIFYYTKRSEQEMYRRSYNYFYTFTNIHRPIEIGVSQNFFDYENLLSGLYIPTAYAFFGMRASSPLQLNRMAYKVATDIPILISDYFDTTTIISLAKVVSPEFVFDENPSVRVAITMRDCVLNELSVGGGLQLADFTNVTLNLYNCTIAALTNTTIGELVAFLNEYDFWYNGIRYTSGSLPTTDLDNRYFTRTIVEDASAAYDIVSADIGVWRRFSNNAGVTLTVNANSLTTIGDTVAFDYVGAGSLTVAPGAGVTLHRNANKQLTSDGQYSAIFIKKTAATEYRVFGELAPV